MARDRVRFSQLRLENVFLLALHISLSISVSGFLRLTNVNHNGSGQYSFTFAVHMQLGQRLAYARFRGSVQQGARGTACGFASACGECRIECEWNQYSKYFDAAESIAASGAERRPTWNVPLSVRGRAHFDPIVIQLTPRKRLDVGTNSSQGIQRRQQGPKRIEESWPIRTEKQAQQVLSQLLGEEKLELLQKQLAYLEELYVEVLLDEPCLGNE